jgi:hypothetical protein
MRTGQSRLYYPDVDSTRIGYCLIGYWELTLDPRQLPDTPVPNAQ